MRLNNLTKSHLFMVKMYLYHFSSSQITVIVNKQIVNIFVILSMCLNAVTLGEE